MTTAFIGLGGNIGDPAGSMRQALKLLDADPATSLRAVSRLYRTPPWGKTDQPWFLNACARLETTRDPHGLLELCLSTERFLKRERRERWGPRTIDIDILDYGGEAYGDETLTLPHPRIAERAFVLRPLADIAADLMIDGRTVSEWLEDLDATSIEIAEEGDRWWRG